MSTVFLKILNMSIAAGFLVLAVLLIRPLLKKAPKWIVCLLWAVVALRLMLPVSIRSALSLVPSANTFPKDFAVSNEPRIESGFSFINEAVDHAIGQQTQNEAPPVGNMDETGIQDNNPSHAPAASITSILGFIWLGGVTAMLAYAEITYLRLKRSVSASVKLGGVYVCDDISSTFILGVFRPRIYVSSNIRGNALESVIAHERAHIARRDHIWKPLGFLLLSVHWFNPLMWIAYLLLCRDIESACDEKVISGMDSDGRVAYSQTLLDSSFGRRLVSACPLAFGEVGVKARVRNVLNYKKPAFWAIVLAVIACAVLAVCFLTDPNRESGEVGCVKLSFAEGVEDETVPVSSACARVIKSLVKSNAWQKGEPAGTYTHEFTYDGRKFCYSPGQHLLLEQGKRPGLSSYMSLLYDDWTKLNGFLKLPEGADPERPGWEGVSNAADVRIKVIGAELSGTCPVTVMIENRGSEPFGLNDKFALTGPDETELGQAPAYGGETEHLISPHSFMIRTYELGSFGELKAGDYRLDIGGGKLAVKFKLNADLSPEAPIAEAHSENPSVVVEFSKLNRYYPGFGVEVIMRNPTMETFSFGEMTKLYSLAGEEQEVALTVGGTPVSFSDVGHLLMPGASIRFEFMIMTDADLNGRYRLYLMEDSKELWVDITIEQNERSLEKLLEEHPEYRDFKASFINVYAHNSNNGWKCIIEPWSNEYDVEEKLELIRERGISPQEAGLILSAFNEIIRNVIPLTAEGEPEVEPETACAEINLLISGKTEYTEEEARQRLLILRGRNPQYFDLDASKGLEVYVWQMGQGDLSFGLLPATEEQKTYKEKMDLYPGCGIMDMKLILSTYNIDPEDVKVIPFQQPLSSYIPFPGANYVQEIRRLLGLNDGMH